MNAIRGSFVVICGTAGSRWNLPQRHTGPARESKTRSISPAQKQIPRCIRCGCRTLRQIWMQKRLATTADLLHGCPAHSLHERTYPITAIPRLLQDSNLLGRFELAAAITRIHTPA